MKIPNKIIFSIIITSLWIFFIIWNRFIRERLPKIIVSQTIIDLYLLFIIGLFMGSFLFLTYYILKYVKIIPRPNSKLSIIKSIIINYLIKQKWFLILNNFINEHIMNGPKSVYDDIIYRYIYIRPFIKFIGAKLSYHFQESPKEPYFMFFVLPKIVPWIVLFLELVYTSSINYFYKSLVLLVIPLIFDILLYIIKHHSIQSIKSYEKYFEFDYIDEQVHVYFKDLSNFSKEENGKQELYSERAGDDWFFYQNLYSVSYKIKEKKDYYNVKLMIVVYSLMTIDFFIYILLLLGLYY